MKINVKVKRDSVAEVVLCVAIGALIVAIVYAVSGLCMWGVGNLVIHVFDIEYTWTYMHGLCTSIVLSIIGGAFKSSGGKK